MLQSEQIFRPKKMTQILLGANPHGEQVHLNLSMANRHGLIAGATGTGKTVSLQILAEGFSKNGIPVFTADVKGDLAGMSVSGKPHEKIDERVEKIGITDYQQNAQPTVFWDVYGENGHPIRTTISEMGPLLLSRLLGLNDTQDAVLHMAFKIADDEGMLLLDTKDLKQLLIWMSENRAEIKKEYGNVSDTTLGAIQRQLMVLNEAGGETFFGEPALNIEHLMKKDFSGNGIINILDARKLMIDPRIYSTFMLWLLSELFEKLPEVGDSEKPKMVFFFDEAHLLFEDAPKVLLNKIEQVARLIRSKGVGVYFVSQNPLDVPDDVRSQLGNRVQHALRAFTPKDQKAVASAAETFRANENFDTAEVIGNLSVGEALVSTLDEKGRPQIVQQTLMCPPSSKMGSITAEERTEKISASPLGGIYDTAVDRESAYEMLRNQAEQSKKRVEEGGEKDEKYYKKYKDEAPEEEKKNDFMKIFDTGKRQGYAETMAKQMARSMAQKAGTKIINAVMRGLLGSLK